MKCMDGELPDGERFFQRAAGCWNGGRSARWISPRSSFFERASASVEKDGFFPLQKKELLDSVKCRANALNSGGTA